MTQILQAMEEGRMYYSPLPAAANASASSNINDNLRYTYTVSEGSYGDDVVHVITALDDLGYERIAGKNMWKNEEGYTSVHALYRTKEGQTIRDNPPNISALP